MSHPTDSGSPDQTRAPFLESLIATVHAQPVSFNMPGHKFSPAAMPEFAELFGAGVLIGDLSEAVPSIDYLHGATGALAEAQRLAAAAVGADETFFLVNGATVGNQAMLMACAREGERVIVPRAAHRSVYAGLVLSGATPVYVPPRPHPLVGFPLAVTPADVASCLSTAPDAVAIQITSPSYYGYVSDTAALVALAHDHGIPLLVDEAHGAHFPYHPDLPRSAVALGADLVVQSSHKTLGALTQAALLHLSGGRVDRGRVRDFLALLQSSSTSVLLTGSLDAARRRASQDGQRLLGAAVRMAQHARAAIREIPGLWCYGKELVGAHGIAGHDPTKLVIRVSDTGWSGTAFAAELWTRFRLSVEFADPRHLICSVSLADDEQRIGYLLAGLRLVAAEQPSAATASHDVWPAGGLPELALTPRQAFARSSRPIRLETAAGAICAEQVIPYPPGIPLLMPGERISAEMIEHLTDLLALGVKIVGPDNPSLQTLRVL